MVAENCLTAGARYTELIESLDTGFRIEIVTNRRVNHDVIGFVLPDVLVVSRAAETVLKRTLIGLLDRHENLLIVS